MCIREKTLLYAMVAGVVFITLLLYNTVHNTAVTVPQYFSAATFVKTTGTRTNTTDSSSTVDSRTKACDVQFQNSHFMTGTFLGRTGNNMFQYAMLLATARRHCYTPYIQQSLPLLESAFNNTGLVVTTRRSPVLNNRQLHESGSGTYDNHVESLATTTNWSFCCFYESWRYFHHNQEVIRSAFTFKTSIQLDVARFVREHVKPSANLTQIGVHVRRTDMTSAKQQAAGFGVPNSSYIHNAMAYFRKQFTNIKFIIASDDITWCKNAIKGSDVIFSNFKAAALDLALIAQCDHVIITLGTFGWWGGWLSGGTVVHFAGFPTPGSRLTQSLNVTDYYPPNWIAMH